MLRSQNPPNARQSAPRPRGAGVLADRRGATALEFALLAAPLLFALFASLEVILVVMATSALASATTTAARQIRTGQLQKSGTATSQSFAQQVCNNMAWLGGQCVSNLYVDAQVSGSFSTIAPPSPITNGAFDSTTLSFNIGNAGDIVLVRTYYKWKLITPFLNTAFGALDNGQIVLTATAAFRNEPFS